MISRFFSASPRYAEDDGLPAGAAGSETTPDPVQGQGSTEAPVTDGERIEDVAVGVGQADIEDTTAIPEKPSSFYQYDWGENGGLQEWGTKEEFDEFFRNGVLRHGDYTNKAKELGFERKKLESEQERIQLIENQLMQGTAKQKELTELLDTLTEEEFKDVVDQVREKYSYASNPALKEIQELKKQNEEREKADKEKTERGDLDRQREVVYATLEKEIPDFNRDTVIQAGKSLQEAAPGEDIRNLALLLHYSEIGKMRAAEYARKIAGNIQNRKNGQPVIPASVVNVGGGANPDYSGEDWNDIAAAAKQETGLR